MIRATVVIAVAAALASCSAPDGEDAAVGGLTPGEATQLDKAAEQLDARAPSPARAEAEALEAQSRAELEEQRRAIDAR